MKAKELREQLAELRVKMQSMTLNARKEDRGLNSEELATFNRMREEAKDLDVRAQGLEAIENFENDTLENISKPQQRYTPHGDYRTTHKVDFQKALRGVLTRGTQYGNPEWEAEAQKMGWSHDYDAHISTHKL